MRLLASIAIVLSLGLGAPAALADNASVTSGDISVADAAMDAIKSATGGKKLHCSGAPGKKTCTSDYAWVCPSGWRACRLTGTAKTCCTQN